MMKHDDADLLVQRFIDQELSGEERLLFLSRLGRDEVLRQRTMNLEQLMLSTSRLSKPVVPANFVSQVVTHATAAASSHAENTSWWQNLSEAFWQPRRLQWNIASAAAMACMAFIVIGSIVALQVRPRRDPAPTVGNSPAAAQAISTNDVLVRLVILQPGARTVEVAGDFNGWNPSRTPLEQIANGGWAVTIPLKPGRYEYMFVVDGKQWVVDPFASEQSEDGFGSRNAVLDVRAPSGASL